MRILFWSSLLLISFISYYIGIYNEKNRKIDIVLSCQVEVIELMSDDQAYSIQIKRFYSDKIYNANAVIAFNALLRDNCLKNEGKINYNKLHQFSKN